MHGAEPWKFNAFCERIDGVFFLEKEDGPRPLHLEDAYGHFINYSRGPYKVLQTIYLNPPSWQHMPLLLSI